MKNLYSLLIILSIFPIKLNAQWVNIPDSTFSYILNIIYPQCMNGNQMDTTCSAIINEQYLIIPNANISDLTGMQYFDNLIQLECWDNQLIFLPPLPSTLEWLDCKNNQLTSLPSLPNSLSYMHCHGNQLSSLPQLPNSLTYLHIDYNQFTSLPSSLPSSLLYFTCSSNQITNLPPLPNNLQGLQIHYNQISSLPPLPATLTSLQCYTNQISLLPTLPNSLTHLSCGSNQLTSLPTLPPNLESINCDGNQITVLPSLPNTLKTLWCSGNQLTSIPVLPSSLISLKCNFNSLSSLPILPNGLKFLECRNNQLTTLPSLPQNLEVLKCHNNQINSISFFPTSLKEIECNNNQLISLPQLPDTLFSLHIQNNPNLLCLPMLKKINWLYYGNTGIQCLPNYGTVTIWNPPITTYPLCDIYNPDNCDVFWNISGKVYSDTNSNCIADANEPRLQNMKLQLLENGTLIQQVFSGAEGLYSFDTDTGVFITTVDTTDLPVMVTCPSSGFYTSNLTPLDSMDYNMDFAMQCKPGFDVGVKNIIRKAGQFFPGNNATLKIGAGDLANFYGFQCAAGISGSIVIDITGPVTFVSEAPGALVPTFAGNILTYNITDFGMVNFNSDFMFILATDTTAQAGDQVCFTVNVTPTSGDNNVSNNNLQHCFPVVNSFDPNAKEVFPSENVSLNQEWLTYTIHFQNTGNAPAQNIFLIDTLDQNLIPSSFTLLAYSHELMTQVFDNVVRFNFPNINLPDSTNDEPNSHGYVQYKVKLNSGLPFGTIISNIAYNFFDFNPPVATNSVQISLGTVGIIENNPVIDFNVYPVPTIGEATISFTLENPVEVKIELYNTLGQLVNTISRKKLPSGKNQINFTTENLFKGVYYIKLSVDENVAVKRLIKM